MKTKKKLPLNHKWRCDKIGSRVGSSDARDKALAEVKRRAEMYRRDELEKHLRAIAI